MDSRFELRRQLRQQRRAVPPRARAAAGEKLARVLARAKVFRKARRIACFFAADGEIDTEALIHLAWRRGKQVYLPVLAHFGGQRLWFRRYRPGSTLQPNRFRIPEPTGHTSPRLSARRLDLVLTPLVAFDRAGRRLGMGGGYYDRTFAFLNRANRWQRPRLVGLAYTFQEVAELPAEPWDVPLWGVATERGLIRSKEKT